MHTRALMLGESPFHVPVNIDSMLLAVPIRSDTTPSNPECLVMQLAGSFLVSPIFATTLLISLQTQSKLVGIIWQHSQSHLYIDEYTRFYTHTLNLVAITLLPRQI